MSYFRIFPKTLYRIDDSGNKKIVVDILRRFSFSDQIKNNGDLFLKYRLRDGERIEDLALKLYGSAQYHWILYLMNDIVDPYTDLPKSQEELRAMIEMKYPGTALMMSVNQETSARAFQGDFLAGETVKAYSFVLNNGEESFTELPYSAVVQEWDGNFRKLVVSSEQNTTFAVSGVKIIGLTSGAKAVLKRRMNNKDSVHHFEDEFGNTINHLPSPLDPTEVSPLDAYVNQTEMVGYSPISNTLYEEKQNEIKSVIKILRVEFAQQIISDSQKVFNK